MSRKTQDNETVRRPETRRVFGVLTGTSGDDRMLSPITYLALILIGVVALGFGAWLGIRAIGRALYAANPKFAIVDPATDIVIVGAEAPLERLIRSTLPGFIVGNTETGKPLGEGSNVFNIDLDRLRNHVAQIGAIGFVRVGRRLPNNLLIEVEKRVPVARQPGSTAPFFMVTDANGVVFRERNPAYGALPEFIPGGANSWSPTTVFSEPQDRAAFEFLAGLAQPEIGLQCYRVDARPAERLDAYIRWNNAWVECSFAWDDMGSGTRRSRSSLNEQLNALKARLAGLDGRNIRKIAVSPGGRIVVTMK